jgi:hypothetical protein
MPKNYAGLVRRPGFDLDLVRNSHGGSITLSSEILPLLIGRATTPQDAPAADTNTLLYLSKLVVYRQLGRERERETNRRHEFKLPRLGSAPAGELIH